MKTLQSQKMGQMKELHSELPMKTIVAAAIGECVHVAGVINFLRLAEEVNWRVVFLGPATPIKKILEEAKKENADLVGVSYRLTPENGERLLGEFAEEADELRNKGVKFAFGGTPPVVDRIKELNFFEVCFDGKQTTEEVVAYLKGQNIAMRQEEDFPQKIVERIKWKSPFPLVRHHFGLPTIQTTLEGIKQISIRTGWMLFHWVLIRMHRKTSSILSGKINAGLEQGVFRCELQKTIESCMKLPAVGISR